MAHTNSNTTDTTKDVSQLNPAEFPSRALPTTITNGQREPRFQAVIRQSALNTLHRHGLSQDVEVCGVLVGSIHSDPSGPWLYVQDAIEGDHATSRAAQATFTAETWAHIQSVMDRDHPDKRILGWYHTHPGFGIFLSQMDLFIQENFFPLPWQVALVYDPKASEEGLFVWKDNKPTVEVFLTEPDQPKQNDTFIVRQAKDTSPGAAASADAVLLAQRLDHLERRQKLILTLLAIIGLIALAWPLIVTAFLPTLFNPKDPPPHIPLQAEDIPGRPARP